MTALVTQRFHRLADTLTELKVKLRAALATELAGAVGNAIRDVLVVTLLDRLVGAPPRIPSTTARSGDWREEYDRERDRWDEPRDPWDDTEYDRGGDSRTRPTHNAHPAAETRSVVPAVGAVAIGVNVGRWWFTRQGSVFTAIGLGTLATALGLVGGPVARAVLAVLATTTDVLTAEAVLARVSTS
jgi:hypothetical protein